MIVYDYGLFYEDGTRDDFWLEYGPINTERPDAAVMIVDWRNDEYIKRFDTENDGKVIPLLDEADRVHSLVFILVNPPRELETE